MSSWSRERVSFGFAAAPKLHTRVPQDLRLRAGRRYRKVVRGGPRRASLLGPLGRQVGAPTGPVLMLQRPAEITHTHTHSPPVITQNDAPIAPPWTASLKIQHTASVRVCVCVRSLKGKTFLYSSDIQKRLITAWKDVHTFLYVGVCVILNLRLATTTMADCTPDLI